MNKIEDLNHDDLIKLTEEELQHLVDIEVAYAGIKLVNPIKMKEVLTINISPVETYYQVHGLLYRTQEEAQAVAVIPAFQTAYDYYGGGYDYKYAEPHEASITKVMLYKKEDVDTVRSSLQKIREAKEYNQKMQSEYEKYLKSIDGCRATVHSIYRKAIEKEEAINRCILDYKKYFVLADNSEEIAMNFFNMAYKDEPEDIKETAIGRLGLSKRVEAHSDI